MERCCRGVSGVVLRALATRGRKRVPASEAQRGGWSEAEGPQDNTAYDISIVCRPQGENAKVESPQTAGNSTLVPPRRIERLSSEPESEILSIKLQGHVRTAKLAIFFEITNMDGKVEV